MAHRPTLVSLAKDLGVSRQTVSNAINRPEVVAPETLERVLAAIEQTNYRPMRAARQLRTKNSRTIAVRIMPEYDGISGHILNHFNHQLAQTAGEFQYRMITLVARDNGDEVANYAEMFNDGDIDGVILSSTTLGDERPARLLELGIPFASFGRPWGTYDDGQQAPFSWVDVDCAAGTSEATRALMDAGHRRIGYLSWPIVPGIGKDRYEGWAATMEGAGLEVSGLVEISEDHAQGLATSARLLIDRGATAIVCASDSLALGALPVCQASGAALIGFDGTPVARALAMNSVEQPVGDVAITAFHMLFDVMQDRAAVRHTLLTPQLVLRNRLDVEPVF